MVILQKNLPDGIIGEVPLTDEPGGNVIGTAQVEKVGRNIMVVVDAADIPEAVTEGFSLGSFSIAEDIDPATIQPFEETHATYGEMVSALEVIGAVKPGGTFSNGE